jgi:hypothetical protein
VSAAGELPDPLADELLDAARDAFTQALQLTSVTSVAIVVGMAILAAILLRDVRSAGSEPGDHPATEPGGKAPDGCTPGFEES